MNGRDAVLRLYLLPKKRFWAFTALTTGQWLVVHGAQNQKPQFDVVAVVAEAKKVEQGYRCQGHVRLSKLSSHVALSGFQEELMLETAETFEVLLFDDKKQEWINRPTKIVIPEIVVDSSVDRYTW